MYIYVKFTTIKIILILNLKFILLRLFKMINFDPTFIDFLTSNEQLYLTNLGLVPPIYFLQIFA